MNYHDFAYTAYASEMPFSGDNLIEDDNSNDDTSNDQPVINDTNLKLELVSEGLQ
jgi:hypothetical protein